MISAIVAVDNNWGIGFNGELLERIPEDLQYFKSLIEDNLLVCGSKTYEGLPRRAFAQRNMIIISRQRNGCIPNSFTCYMSLEECVNSIECGFYRDYDGNDKDIFIIGGGQIYKELLPLCDRVYVTKIYKDHENVDTYFPNLDKSDEWTPACCSDIRTYNDLSYQFWQYDRIS